MTQDPIRQAESDAPDGERVTVRDGDRSGHDASTPADTAVDPGLDAGADDPRAAALAAEVAERTADLQRLSAEYANYRRRVDRDREAVLVNARAQFVGELLTVLDDVERAGRHGDLVGPFKSVADKLVSVVQKLGLEPFGTEGEPFDPAVHEAVQHEPSDATGPTVTVLSAVLRRGYRIGDRVLRPAMVGVVDRSDDGTALPTDAVTDDAGTVDDASAATPPTGIPVVDVDPGRD